MTKNNEEKTINSLFDCKKCKLKSEEECLIYERCYKANEYICNLNKNLKAKEQECERLRFPMQDTNYAILAKEEFEEYKKLKQTLTEIKEIAELACEKSICDRKHCDYCSDGRILKIINEVCK